MATIQYREVRRRIELDGVSRTIEHFTEALGKRLLRPEDFSIRQLAEATITTRSGDPVGHEWVHALDPRQHGTPLLEAGEAIDSTAFASITGQVIFSKILEAYQHSAFVMSRLVDTIPTRFSGEKIPGIARVGDKASEVREGQPFPSYGFGEEYIETPETVKRGFIIPVTREAVFFDRTNLVLKNAAEVGEFLGLNKEKRLVDLLIGAVNNYKRNGTAVDTYQTVTPWINVKATNELVDWTNVEAAELLLSDMSDPNTGEPVLIVPNAVVAMPAKKHTLRNILHATQINVGDGSGGTTQTISLNPLAGDLAPHVSVLAYQRIQSELSATAADAAKWWFLGDFRRAFAYMENWAIGIRQAPVGSEAEFTQDIFIRYRADERGAAAVIDPRFVVKNTG